MVGCAIFDISCKLNQVLRRTKSKEANPVMCQLFDKNAALLWQWDLGKWTLQKPLSEVTFLPAQWGDHWPALKASAEASTGFSVILLPGSVPTHVDLIITSCILLSAFLIIAFYWSISFHGSVLGERKKISNLLIWKANYPNWTLHKYSSLWFSCLEGYIG